MMLSKPLTRTTVFAEPLVSSTDGVSLVRPRHARVQISWNGERFKPRLCRSALRHKTVGGFQKLAIELDPEDFPSSGMMYVAVTRKGTLEVMLTIEIVKTTDSPAGGYSAGRWRKPSECMGGLSRPCLPRLNKGKP